MVETVASFSLLAGDELRELMMFARRVTFRPGEFVFDQGVAADGMYVIEHGSVQLWARLLGDEQIALCRIGPGGVLGEFSLFDRGTRSASAEVIEPTEGWFFSNRQFELLRTDGCPAALKTMRQLCKILCERLRTAIRELVENSPAFFVRGTISTAPPNRALEAAPAGALDPRRLLALPCFARLTAPVLGQWLAPLSVWTAPRGHRLYTEGQAPASAYAILRGAVEQIGGPSGEERRVAILGPGKLFGFVAPLDGGQRPTSAIVREDALVLEIPPAEIEAISRGDTSLHFTLLDVLHCSLIERLRAANRTLLCQTAMGRLAQRRKTPHVRVSSGLEL